MSGSSSSPGTGQQPDHEITVAGVDAHAYEQYRATCSCGWADYALRYSRKAAEMDGVEHIEWARATSGDSART